MARASVKLEASDFRRFLENYSDFAKKSVPQLLHAHARLCAVELAHRTQPFSKGARDESGQALGEKATRCGIGGVVKGRDSLMLSANAIKDEAIKERAKALISSGNLQAIAELFGKIGFAKGGHKILTNKASIKRAHNDNRNKRTGRSHPPRELFIASSVDKYSNEVAKRVGMSKAGWASCARKIGAANGLKGDGARGIPGWAKKKKYDNGSVSFVNSGGDSYVLMTNSIPWISRICRKVEQNQAMYYATMKMIKAFEIAILEAAKSNAKMRNITDKLTAKAI